MGAIIGRMRHGAVSSKIRSASSKRKRAPSRRVTAAKSGRERAKVRHALKAKSGAQLRQLMRQSDRRGVAEDLVQDLEEIRTSAAVLQSPQRRTTTRGSNITPELVGKIRSPALRKRLLRHAAK